MAYKGQTRDGGRLSGQGTGFPRRPGHGLMPTVNVASVAAMLTGPMIRPWMIALAPKPSGAG